MPEHHADRLVPLVRSALGDDNVLAVHLHGSAVLGGLRPHSDLDLLAVVRRPTTVDERRALTGGLMKVSGGGHRPVELVVVVRDAVRPWRYPPDCEFLYGEWLRGDYERGVVPGPGPMPDLAPLLTVTLMGNTSLYGPPPAELLDPVPPADLRRAVVEGIPGLMADLGSDTRNVLLTLARIWTTLATGGIRAKDAAADWALDRLPEEHRAVLARARAVCLGQEPERWDDLRAGIRPCADFLVDAVERARDGQPS